MNESEMRPDFLAFLPRRQREMLRRLASKDRRTEFDEIVYLIEARAQGQHQDHGDYAKPPISLSDLPPPLVERAYARREHVEDHDTGSKPPTSSTGV